jgi:hypothetical protein
MLKRLVNWLLGIPRPDRLDEVVAHMGERDAIKDRAIIEAGRSNLAGGKGAGPGARDWSQWG